MHKNFSVRDTMKNLIILKRLKNGAVAKTPAAYALSDKMEITLSVHESIYVQSVDMILYNDASRGEVTFPLDYLGFADSFNSFSVKLDLAKMCKPENDGLFYYCFRINTAEKALFVSSVNNVDFVLTEDGFNVSKFRLLVYNDSYRTPDFAKDAVMYHIFVDRFCKGGKTLPCRDDAVINPDWDNGVPKYAPYPGAPLDNNEFFGGNLYGIAEKLDYLVSLGVNVLYLSPIFKAYSNHKYDTGDYMTVDEMFGGDEAFAYLVKEAKARNMHIILDGVFNHTGSDSKYFNAYGKYNTVGAFQSEDSPYRSWYYFNDSKIGYDCWWGIDILPKLNNRNPETEDFFLGKYGVVRKYLKEGIGGWRLDVADELPHEFLTRLRAEAKDENPDALIIGEVWENAADKIAYDRRRKYFSGYQLDSVMNYPIKNAIANYMKTADCTLFYNTVTEIYASYPEESSAVLMNLLGTHDTERILTSLVVSEQELSMSNADKAAFTLDDARLKRAKKLQKIASVLQFTLPGMPCIFYGDEAGVQGLGDPFCRKPYPWGREDADMVEHYRKLGILKRKCSCFKNTDIEFLKADGGVCIYKRGNGENSAYVCVNMTKDAVDLPENICGEVLFGESVTTKGKMCVLPESVVVIR